MTTFQRTRTVEWGDCDAAGIVFYPNYYRWMDAQYHALTGELGFDQRTLMEEHGLLGTPLVDTGCAFSAPATFGDELTVAARLDSLGRASLRLVYTFTKQERDVATGFEARVFVRRSGAGIEAAPMPERVRAVLEPLLSSRA
jgi:YbgC/YbaW family acyl-CoA thioester hydrolase